MGSAILHRIPQYTIHHPPVQTPATSDSRIFTTTCSFEAQRLSTGGCSVVVVARIGWNEGEKLQLSRFDSSSMKSSHRTSHVCIICFQLASSSPNHASATSIFPKPFPLPPCSADAGSHQVQPHRILLTSELSIHSFNRVDGSRPKFSRNQSLWSPKLPAYLLPIRALMYSRHVTECSSSYGVSRESRTFSCSFPIRQPRPAIINAATSPPCIHIHDLSLGAPAQIVPSSSSCHRRPYLTPPSPNPTPW